MSQDIERNKQIVRRFYEESHKGNLDVYEELLAPDFVSYTSAVGKPLVGPEAFKQAYIMYATAFPDFNTKIDMIIAEGNLVMVYGPATGTHQGAFMGLPPTGKKLEWTGVAIYRFNDAGMIDARWQEIDGLRLFAELGLIPDMFAGG